MTKINLADLTNKQPKKIEVDGVPVCVVRIEEKVYAIGDTCSHSDASLSEGEVKGNKIECWLHGADFDLATGEALTGPASDPVPVFEVEINGNEVTISKGSAA
jgi:3-phenylpropionate/trans-cinnamate dioxygenase ferredoxin subunit